MERGYIRERLSVPNLTTRGMKSKTHHAFSEDEIDHPLAFMETCTGQRRLVVEREMRQLLLTGMRHGTEALGICWKYVEWHTDKVVKHLSVWVDGETGERWLIAKHRAVDVSKRLHERQKDVISIAFEDILVTRVPHKLCRFSDGYQPLSLNGTFRKLMRDSGLEKKEQGQTRTLHNYSTLQLLKKQH